MSKLNLQRVDAAVSRFLQKANNKNEPLEAFRETESFEQLTSKLEKGIFKQAKWLTKNLENIYFLQDESLTDSQFDAKLGAWLSNEMPRIYNYVSQEKVYAYLFNAFLLSIQASYARIGIIQKASGFVEFELTNAYYIAALKDQANYLLNRSSVDETTRKRMITLIRDSRLSLIDLNDLASMIEAEFEGISATRAFQIANTEANQAMSTAQDAFLRENGFKTKKWIPAGPNTCSICQGNADDGAIPLDDAFSSGDMTTPGHPGCECYEDAGDEIDLDSVVLWDGSDSSFSRSVMSQREAEANRQKKESALLEKIDNIKSEHTSELEAIKHDMETRVVDMSKTISEGQEELKAQITEAVKKLSTDLNPEHKTIIQKAEVPGEVINVINMLAELAVAPKEPTTIPLSEYKPHDQQEGDTEYYGFLHVSGAWYVVESTEDQQRYSAGADNYKEAWQNRDNLNYKYIDEAFQNAN